MTTRTCIRGGALIAALAWAAAAIGANVGFMKDTPYAKFTDEDRKIFHEALDETLNKGVDGGAARAWSNPATKASGEIKALRSLERGGATCRVALIANKAKGYSARGEHTLCKDASGKWALAIK